MKKQTVKIVTVIIAVFVALTACRGKSAGSEADELDTAIREASDYLNDNIPAGGKTVILNIQSDSEELSDYIIEGLYSNAVNDNVFSVIDRKQLDLVTAELNFRLSGEVSDDSAVQIGRMLGVQTIVSGEAGKSGNGYRLRIRAMDVQTAQIQGQFSRNIPSSRKMTALMK